MKQQRSSVQRNREQYLLDRLGEEPDVEAAANFIMGTDPDNPFLDAVERQRAVQRYLSDLPAGAEFVVRDVFDGFALMLQVLHQGNLTGAALHMRMMRLQLRNWI